MNPGSLPRFVTVFYCFVHYQFHRNFFVALIRYQVIQVSSLRYFERIEGDHSCKQTLEPSYHVCQFCSVLPIYLTVFLKYHGIRTQQRT